MLENIKVQGNINKQIKTMLENIKYYNKRFENTNYLLIIHQQIFFKSYIYCFWIHKSFE
jgi:hypothetical protein